ncbi:MAG: AMP-binding protein, partial [bacterium]|nr:AMP-binding protein [bacterium]
VSPEAKIYKTGDFARWLADGTIEFIGRIDHQVKVRGFRIEPGEIENQLLNHEDIKEAVVLAKGMNERGPDCGENIGNHICAYITSDRELIVSQLREYLSKRLPHYMIPSYFVKVENIPLTPNGKIDRKALASYDTGIDTGVEYIAPDSDIEKGIAETWKEVLKVDKIGLNDNFFDVGGHSLNLLTVNSRLKKVLGRDIPVVEMFRFPTISTLVGYLNGEETGGLID